jgi:hypothetical protein
LTANSLSLKDRDVEFVDLPPASDFDEEDSLEFVASHEAKRWPFGADDIELADVAFSDSLDSELFGLTFEAKHVALM